MSAPARKITGLRILAIALPVVLSNATVPIQGAVDTGIIGNIGSKESLGGVGLGAQIMSLAVGMFNFIQIGCSGLTAQALGADDHGRVLNTLWRTLAIGSAIALSLILLQIPLIWGGLGIFEASEATEAEAARYVSIRIWGAPFEFANMALLGWFTGQEMTRRLFQHQLVTTLSNITLSLTLGAWLGWGLDGIALATVIASAIGMSYGFWLASARRKLIAPQGWRIDWPRILRRDELIAVMRINADLFIRTGLLMLSFAWMMRLGSLQEDTILAANVVLWQFFIVSSYALDGFAMAAETLVGQAKGAGDRAALRRAAIMTSLWSGGLAVLISAIFAAVSHDLIDLMTDIQSVRETAYRYVLWAALVPAVGFAAFQLDGIFIGATASRAMRNTMLTVAVVYFPFSFWMTDTFGNHGVWAGIYTFLILRALTMLWAYPKAIEGAVLR